MTSHSFFFFLFTILLHAYSLFGDLVMRNCIIFNVLYACLLLDVRFLLTLPIVFVMNLFYFK